MPTVTGRATARQRRRARLFFKQRGLCYWCSRQMTTERPNPKPAPNYATFEHLMPRSRGGKSNYDNVVLACRSCNNHRGNLVAVAPQATVNQ